MALSDSGLPVKAQATRKGLLHTMGIIGEPSSITRTNLSFSPVLTHDSNINGGYGPTTIIIDGLNFNVDKDYKALDGILLGGSVSTLACIPDYKITHIDDLLPWRWRASIKSDPLPT